MWVVLALFVWTTIWVVLPCVLSRWWKRLRSSYLIIRLDECFRPIRCPLFQRGYVWTTIEILKGFRSYFLGKVSLNSDSRIKWCSGSLLLFLTRVVYLLGTYCETTLCFCQRFWQFKSQKFSFFSHFPSFGVWHISSLRVSDISGESFFLFSSDFTFPIALDPFNSSFRNFFVGVCRIVENEGRVIHFDDLILANCVLHHLLEELFALAFPALST